MPKYVDIAVNLTDPMFKGFYHHSSSPTHPADVENVLQRASDAGVEGILVTAGSHSDSVEV